MSRFSNDLDAWQRQMAASIASAHPITRTAPIRARGQHLVASNDEPEPPVIFFNPEDADPVDALRRGEAL